MRTQMACQPLQNRGNRNVTRFRSGLCAVRLSDAEGMSSCIYNTMLRAQ
jgi:hypothetical protein